MARVVDNENRNSNSTGNHVLFCLSHKYNNNDIFDDFPKISNHFP